MSNFDAISLHPTYKTLLMSSILKYSVGHFGMIQSNQTFGSNGIELKTYSHGEKY